MGLVGAGLIGFAAPSLAAAGNAADPATLLALDPELRPVAAKLLAEAAAKPPLSDATLASKRAERAASAAPPLPGIPVTRETIAAGGSEGVTVYVINGGTARAARPAILHMHGGGHVFGAAKNEFRYLQELARDLDCVVVTVEYRLAPETRFTGSVADTYAALDWLYRRAPELGVDRRRLALLGESAGGTHAALLSIRARDIGQIPLAFQALIYPMLDDRTGRSAHADGSPHVVWTAANNRYGWKSFLGAAPAAGGVPARVRDLAGLPPTYIAVGTADLFIDEDIDFSRRLIAARVATELQVFPQAFHAFDRVAPETAIARRFHRAELDAFRRAFA